jgi:hypothetical protein
VRAGYCKNCDALIEWGVVCTSCLRAFATGLAAGLATWLLRALADFYDRHL